MSVFRLRCVAFMLGLLLAVGAAGASTVTQTDAQTLARAVALRNGGSLQQAIEIFSALRTGSDAPTGLAATGELGTTLLQARRYDEAEPLLRTVYEQTEGVQRARYAIELGNLAAARRQVPAALLLYAEARTLAGNDGALTLVARINQARLAERQQRPTLLAAISHDLASIGEPLARAQARLSVGTLAGESGGLQIAYANLEEARNLAAQVGNARIEMEALDGLAQLYEAQGRLADALLLSRRGSALAQAAPGVLTDILLRLEWRQGRLLVLQGANDEAQAAYQRAIAHIESIRQDIPIEYEGGRSSFRDTLEPIYLGLIDLLLRKADQASGSAQDSLLRHARDMAELIKQSELQDYLGERCSVDSAQSGAQTGLAAGTAIVYPIILKDRVEMIFESGTGIARHTSPMDAQALRKLVLFFTGNLRRQESAYLAGASQLYDLLVRPFEKDLQTQGIHTLLVVPDGVLRLLPWATLFDGKQFLVENFAVVVNSGLSMTSQAADRTQGFSALVAGMAEPGPVVEKLALRLSGNAADAAAMQSSVAAGLTQSRATRAISPTMRTASVDTPERFAALKKSLVLPGVKAEVDALSIILPGTRLLDATFTTSRLHDEFDKGTYRIAHLATHGFFGSTGKQSFIMAYDDLVTMDGLQELLQLEGARKIPIELLTLSACETAEGDDRSPLGIAGAAIKAKARSALGTLWPVADDAAQQVMTKFYSSLVSDGTSKAEALRLAQRALIADREFDHPFFWGPFIIIGNWR